MNFSVRSISMQKRNLIPPFIKDVTIIICNTYQPEKL